LAHRVLPVLAASLLLAAGPAAAHAIIIAAKPDVGATVAGPSVAIDLRFNSRIDHLRSRLWLSVADKTIAVGIEKNGPADHLAGAVDALAPGDYVLHWQVLAVDGHITRGDIPFCVAAH
jgi:methionine-rich copper-binding protein CopC